MSPKTDYFAQLRAEMVRVLPTRSDREKSAFAALNLDEQAWRFMNWQSRLVHPHPRQVNKADGFDDLPAVRANRQGVADLLTRIAHGHNVSDCFSRYVAAEGYCLHSSGRKDGRDFDLLLNEWGIHHLHIPLAGKRGVRTRSKELLYGIFGRQVAFILAVAPHGEWTSRRLIEAAVRSWPKQGLFVPLNVVPGRDCSEDEHKALRRAGIATMPVVDNTLWLSGVTLGLTTALVSVRVVEEVGRLFRCLHQATANSEHLTWQLEEISKSNGASWPVCPKISVRWLSGPDRFGFGFVEESNGATAFI